MTLYGNKLNIAVSRQKPDRLGWIDAIKGVCIVCVVLYHVTLGLHENGVLIKGDVLEYFWIYITAIATPPFFIISGYFMKSSIEKYGYHKFFMNGLCFILFPYLLWSIIQVLVKLVFSGYVNKAAEFNLIKTLFLEPTGQFWFLHALFFAQIIFMVIHKFYNRQYFLLFLITAACSLVMYNYQTLSQDIRGLSLVMLGVFFSTSQSLFKVTGNFWMPILVIIFLFSGFIYHVYFVPLGLQSASNFIGGIAVTIIFVNVFRTWYAPKILILLGKHSMYIFLLHLLALVPFRILLIKLGISNTLIFIMILTLSGLFMPLLFAAVIEPIGLSPYLGIKPVNSLKIWRKRE